MQQAHPSRGVSAVRGIVDILVALVQEVVRLREAKHDDDVDDRECKHITGYHGINHRDERSSQSDGTLWKFKDKQIRFFIPGGFPPFLKIRKRVRNKSCHV